MTTQTFLRLIVLILSGSCLPVFAQSLISYTWPTNAGEALVSDKYKVFVREGNGPEQELQVLMSEAIYEGDFRANELAGRTFSFTQVSYNIIGSPGLTFRVEKLFGTTADTVTIHPKSYQLNPTQNGMEVTFPLKGNQKYLSVDFHSADNRVSLPPFMANKGVVWITHMLCIFVDPAEPIAPSGAGVVDYSPTVSPTQLQNASVIAFRPGYHNLNDYQLGGIIDADGVLTLQDGQHLYIAGGAFVEGIIGRKNFGDDNQRIYGRGILTGRQYLWRSNPNHSGREYGEIARMGSGDLEGIMMMESPNHGVVGNNIHVDNFKYLGWHSNNDGIRVGSGSEIEHSFLRCVDDHFYNFDIYVHDCVLWAGHNGSIMTYGWGGEAGSNTYNSGSSFMDNVDIIHPEWSGLGNNNGLIMAQVGLDYKPFGYGGPLLTHFRNIRMEGKIAAITNLKPRSSNNGIPSAVQVPAANVGYLGDLLLENIRVESQIELGRIRGTANASTTGNLTFFVQNVEFRNVTIGGQCVDETNKGQFFDIDAATTKDLVFGACAPNSLFSELATKKQLGSVWFEEGSGEWQVTNLGVLPCQVELINFHGQVLRRIPELRETDSLNTQTLPRGVYVVRFQLASAMQTVKILVQ